MDDLAKIRERARTARDDDYYDKNYALALVMSGQFKEAATPNKALRAVRRESEDLGDYPYLNPELGPGGQQNHALVNSRINVQGIVHIDPEFSWSTDDPIAKQVLDAQVRAWWNEGVWADEFYQTGMEVEAFGIGFCEFGITDGRLSCVHRSLFDLLWDRNYRSPKDWRYLFSRVRLDLYDAKQKYGDLFGQNAEEELKRLSVPAPYYYGRRTTSGQGSRGNDMGAVIHEWTYWDSDHRCVFLGGIQRGKALVFEDGKFKEADKAAPNPYGIIPYSTWIDSWVPGISRPVGKSENTYRLAVMLNEIEAYCTEIVERGVPLITVNTDRVDPEVIDRLKAVRGSKDIANLLLLTGSGSVKDLLDRTDPLEVPQTLIYFRQVLKEELNAATGVMDMQRGQALGGERRTRFEVAKLADAQGVQARHTRERYGKFLETSVQVARVVALRGESVNRTLQLEDGVLDTAHFPVEPFLESAIFPKADPATMFYKSDDEKRIQAVEEFEAVDAKAIELGVADPYRTFQQLYRKMGRRDPVAAGLYSPEEYALRQQQMAMAALLGQGAPQDGSGSQVPGGGGSPGGPGGQDQKAAAGSG